MNGPQQAHASAERQPQTLVESLLDALHARTPLRAGSLIVTIFGDAVAPRGGVLSLAALLRLTAAFRLSDGLVRTVLSRLVADGWFERTKAGRNSFYRLTASGRTTFAAATDKIYHANVPVWDGTFDLVLLNGEGREALRAALAAAGFGQASADLMIAPAPSRAVETGVSALRLSATADAFAARELAQRGWPLAEAARRYAHFLEIYAPVAAQVHGGATMSDLESLIVRVLLIHDFRRAVLKDPHLPAALLPEDWPGAHARASCGVTYRAVAAAAERWLDRCGAGDDGPLPQPDGGFWQRFTDT